MRLMDAFKALEDVVDEVVEEKKFNKVNKTLKESVETINISGDDMYEKGKAYYYAHTGDTVTLDDESKKYMIIQDKDGGHKIGYTDTLLLKDLQTGEQIEISKKDFISKAQLVKECVKESQEDYYVLSDGKNPKNSHVYDGSLDVEEFIKSLEDTKSKGDYGYWELLHYVNGKDTKIWSTEEGKIKVESCKEGCDLKEEPTYDLGTQFDSRQSFYGKAKVDVRPDGSQVLYSYGSPVCQITKDGKPYLLRHVNGYASYASSQTTLRHVKEFLKQNGFKADSLKQMEKDYPIQSNSFVESLQLKESEAVSINDKEEVKKGKEILSKKEEDQPEQIVDVDADTIDKIKDSYLGNAILQCPVCRTLIYKKPDALVKDEESQLYNVKEVCPHCGSEDGYELVGQVASLDVPVEEPEQTTGTEEVEIKDEVKEPEVKEPERAPRALAPMAAPERESLEIKELNEEKFDKLINKYAIATYNNVESYKTTGGKFVEDTGEIILEGVVKYTSGKEAPVTFRFVEKALTKGGKCKLTGICEKFAKDKKAYVMIGNLKEGYLNPESMSYNYSVNVLEESKTIRGRVNLRKDK